MLFLLNKKLRYFVVWSIFLTASTTSGQDIQTASNQQVSKPLNLLVLGDSILWGQGLKAEHKPSYYVKIWLEQQTGRRVIDRIEAHSGALIEASSGADKRRSTNREVNLGLPSIHDEIDSALNFYPVVSDVELVLVSGCGNDVGVQNLLNASNTEDVNEMTEAKCGKPVEKLLRRITTTFPAAHVILTGYYPFFSSETRNDFVVKAFARRFLKTNADDESRMNSKEVFERLKTKSKQWYEASNARLSGAVRTINSEIGLERVSFVRIEFPAAYSFAARQTHLWDFNRSIFRMALLFISFGKVPLPTNDDMRKDRIASCNELYREQPNETIEKKRDRKALRLYCKYAALGHPNRKGALLYAEAIKNVLRSNAILTASTVP